MEAIERAVRAHPRVPANLVVRVVRRGRALFARARDLSMVGLFVEAPLDKKEEVDVAIALPGETEALITQGRVERTASEGAALTFTDLRWDHLFALARFVSPRLP